LGDTYDERTDVFSFGIMLWELITKKRTFSQMNSDEEREKLKIDRISLSFFRYEKDDLPKEYQSIYDQCTARNYQDRPSFDEILKQLKQLQF